MLHHRIVDRYPGTAYRIERAVERGRRFTSWQRYGALALVVFLVSAISLATVAAFKQDSKPDPGLIAYRTVEIDVPSRRAARIDEKLLLERQRYASRLNEELNRRQPPPVAAYELHAALPDPLTRHARETSTIEIAIPPKPAKQEKQRIAAKPKPAQVKRPTVKKAKSDDKKRASELANRDLSIDAVIKSPRTGRRVELDGPLKVTAKAGSEFDLPLAIIDPSGRTRNGQVIVGGLPEKATIDFGKRTGISTWRLPAKDSDLAAIRLPRSARKNFRLTLALRAPGIDPPLIRRVKVTVQRPSPRATVPVANNKKTKSKDTTTATAAKPAELTSTKITAKTPDKGNTVSLKPDTKAAEIKRMPRVQPRIVKTRTPDLVPVPTALTPSKTASTDPMSGIEGVVRPAEIPAAKQSIAPAAASREIELEDAPAPTATADETEQERATQTADAASRDDAQEDNDARTLKNAIDPRANRQRKAKRLKRQRPRRVTAKPKRKRSAPAPARAPRKSASKASKKRGGYNNLGWNPFNGN